ncbi:MAG: dihydrodipicolinate reductase [Desulfobacterales bacterium]|nr:dihydrodipicolinate reductase [Desulfobacterales bacterium]
MEKRFLMINGLPGKVACTMAQAALADPRFQLVPFSLTGQDIPEESHIVDGTEIQLVKPDVRDDRINEIQSQYPGLIAVDYTHPTAVEGNVRFYSQNKIPFVMGTTGGDFEKLKAIMDQGTTPAVIAPNMAKQIVGFQTMMDYAATKFPGLFDGYKLRIKESHQQTKADTSGTAKAMVGYFNELGMDFNVSDIEQERDPKSQEENWNIPREHLDGHAWHTYTLTSPDDSVCFEFTHNINGRQIYVDGTFDAVDFLGEKLGTCKTGEIFTMMDVLNKA